MRRMTEDAKVNGCNKQDFKTACDVKCIPS